MEGLCNKLSINFKEFLDKYSQEFNHQGTNIKLPSDLNEDFAQFLGYLIGDGCIETDRVSFFEQDEQRNREIFQQ